MADGRPLPQLTSEPAFRALADYHEKNGKQINIRQLFKQDPNRFQNYRFVFIGISNKYQATDDLCPDLWAAFARTAVKSG